MDEKHNGNNSNSRADELAEQGRVNSTHKEKLDNFKECSRPKGEEVLILKKLLSAQLLVIASSAGWLL